MANPTIRSFEDGTVRSISWWDEGGNAHRIGGPSEIEYWSNGNIRWMVWNLHNQHHRLDGPAHIRYDEQGNIEDQNWYIEGFCVNENILGWLEENNITEPFSDEDRMAIKLYLS